MNIFLKNVGTKLKRRRRRKNQIPFVKKRMEKLQQKKDGKKLWKRQTNSESVIKLSTDCQGSTPTGARDVKVSKKICLLV